MRMDAKQLSEHLVDYLYGELTAEQAAAFERSLQDHPEVQRELEAMQQTRSVLGDMEQFDPPPALTDRLMAEAAARAPRAPQPSLLERIHAGLKLLVVHPAVSAAVTVVVVVGLSLYVYRLGKPTEDAPPAGIVAHPQHEDLVASKFAGSAQEPAAERPSENDEGGRVEPAGLAAKKQAAEPEADRPRLATDKADRAGRRAAVGKSSPPQKRTRRSRRSAKRKSRSVAKRPSLVKNGAARGARTGRKALPQRSLAAKPATAPPRDEADLALDAKRRVAATPFPAAPKGSLGAGSAAKQPSVASRRAPARAYEGRGVDSLADDADVGPSVRSKSERKREALNWLARGSAAVKAKNCKAALAYFNQAVRTDTTLAAQVDRRLGPCASQLDRSFKSYPVLIKRVYQARMDRLKRDKAATEEQAPAAAPAETEKKR